MEVKYSIKGEARAFAHKEREFSTYGICFAQRLRDASTSGKAAMEAG
jgi:hypothetical protein